MPEEKTNSKRRFTKIFCYSLSLLVTTFFIYALYTIINLLIGERLLNFIISLKDSEISNIIITLGIIGFLFLLYSGSKIQGDLWRSKEGDINLIGITSIPNYFYDETFVTNHHYLNKKIKNLEGELKVAKKLLSRSNEQREKQEENIKQLTSNLSVFIRHHQNASRLMGSMSYLFDYHNINKIYVDEMIKNVLSECITVLNKDQSDKSVALFEVGANQKLIIREYFRIGAKSSHDRQFEKGQGFAGSIWDKQKPEMVPDVRTDQRFNKKENGRYSFLSIMGLPIKVGNKTVGVLCIQSELINGFSEDDLLAIEFYVNLCAFLLQYDNIKESQMMEGDARA